MAIRDYSLSASLNTEISGINIGEGAPAGNMNNALRQLMADIRAGFYQTTFEGSGAIGDGSADDAAALAAALDADNLIYGGGPDSVYLSASGTGIQISQSVIIDGRGATFKPSGTRPLFTRTIQTTAATTVTAASAGIGLRTVTVASSTGLAAPQWIRIYADNTAEDDNAYPDFWAKITNVVGTTITFDRELPVDYTGATTVNLEAFDAANIIDRVIFRNCVFDGSASSQVSPVGAAIRLSGVERVLIENCEFKNFDNATTGFQSLVVFECIDVSVRNCRFTGQIAQDVAAAIDYCRSGEFTGNKVDGSGFGLSLTRCEKAVAAYNTLQGRAKQESDDGVSPIRSARGIKAYGCAMAIIHGNDASDYESAIRIQAGWRYTITGNTLKNNGLYTFSGQLALSVGSQLNGTNQSHGVIANNIVENSGGNAIGVSTDTTGRLIIANNVVKRCVGYGIYCNVNNATISGNRVDDWGLRNAGDVGIYYASGVTAIGNRFNHQTLPALSCFRSNFVSTFKYVFDGNTCESANPMGVTMEAAGTGTIASGSTTATITHTLSVTPAASDFNIIFTENPTNDPGNWWLGAVGSTTVPLNVRADPGASNLDFSWKASVKQPFTAP